MLTNERRLIQVMRELHGTEAIRRDDRGNVVTVDNVRTQPICHQWGEQYAFLASAVSVIQTTDDAGRADDWETIGGNGAKAGG